MSVDCRITKAPRGGEKAGESPVDRGKQGLKRSMMVDGEGIPLGVVAAGANRHDSPLLAPTLDAPRGLGGLPDPVRVHLDRAYDSNVTRQLLEDRGLVGVISSKGEPAPLGATKRRVIERTNSWTNAHKKLLCGVPRGREESSTSGLPFPTRSLSWDGLSEKPGVAIAGRVDLLADRDLLARALKRAGLLNMRLHDLQNVEAEALLGERAVGEVPQERVDQYLVVDAFYRMPELTDESSALVRGSLRHKTSPVALRFPVNFTVLADS